MGLLKAGIGSVGGALADSWKDFITCEALDDDVLVAKGQKKTSKRSSNRKGSDNIITNGSIVTINEGQCMMIVDQGVVVDLSAEPGEFIYDSSTEPSLFCGDLEEGILQTFQQIGKRFTFGGEPPKDQRVYYFNIKEIMGNKYGTSNPVPFRVVDKNIGLDIDIAIRCHGEYSYHIVDPMLFYTNVSGNVETEFRREEIDKQFKSELMTALQPAFAKISEMGIRYSALPGHTLEISKALNDALSDKWRKRRGIEIVEFGINSVTASKEDEDLIKELQRNAVYQNPSMAGATLVGAQAQAMQDAAKNTATGPMMAFAGMNMAQGAGGANAQDFYQQAEQNKEQQKASPAADAWTCSCGTQNAGKFCTNCGKAKPAPAGSWTCSCGTQNTGKFCTNCGKPAPVQGALKCIHCGYELPEGTTAPKFCPNCGKPFSE